MNSNDPLYAIYDNYIEQVILISYCKDDIKEYIDLRTKDIYGNLIESEKDKYQVAKITNKSHIQQLKDSYLEGEVYGGYLLSSSEFELFAEYMAYMNTAILYDLEVKIIENLKYLKLCDEDLITIIRAISIMKSKVELIENGPPDDDPDNEIYDEDNVYYLDKVAKQFLLDNNIIFHY